MNNLLQEKLSKIIWDAINEARVQRTIPKNIWLNMQSLLSKGYRPTMGADAKVKRTWTTEYVLQMYVVALICLKQECPVNEEQLENSVCFPNYAKYLRIKEVDVNEVIRLYNENTGKSITYNSNKPVEVHSDLGYYIEVSLVQEKRVKSLYVGYNSEYVTTVIEETAALYDAFTNIDEVAEFYDQKYKEDQYTKKLYNDGDHFFIRIMDMTTGKKRKVVIDGYDVKISDAANETWKDFEKKAKAAKFTQTIEREIPEKNEESIVPVKELVKEIKKKEPVIRDINDLIFADIPVEKKKEIVNNYENEFFQLTESTLIKMYNTSKHRNYWGHELLYVNDKYEAGNYWDSDFKGIYVYKNKVRINLYFQMDSTDTEIYDDFSKFIKRGTYVGEYHTTDYHGNPTTEYCEYTEEDKVKCLKGLILSYLDQLS